MDFAAPFTGGPGYDFAILTEAGPWGYMLDLSGSTSI